MNLTQFFQRAPSYMDRRYAIHLIGSSGIGKSDGCTQLGRMRSEQDGEEWGISTNLVASMTPPDVQGYLMAATRKITDRNGVERDVLMSEFSLPPWCISDTGVPLTQYRRSMVIFEEYGQGDPDTKRSLGEPVLHARAGRHQLPPGACVLLCSNAAEHRSGVTKDFDFMINRWVQFRIRPHVRSWVDWAHAHKVHPLWIHYAETHPQIVFADEHPAKQGPWCTPRSFTRFCEVLTADYIGKDGRLTTDPEARELMLEEGAGAIGESAIQDILTWAAVQADVPTVDEVAANPKSALLPVKPDCMTLIVYMLAAEANNKNIPAFATYISRLPAEFVVTFALAAIRRDRTLATSAAMVKYVIAKNATIINAIAAL